MYCHQFLLVRGAHFLQTRHQLRYLVFHDSRELSITHTITVHHDTVGQRAIHLVVLPQTRWKLYIKLVYIRLTSFFCQQFKEIFGVGSTVRWLQCLCYTNIFIVPQ